MSSFLPKIFKDVDNTDLYQKALEKWGEGPQLLMLVEECGELLAKLSQFQRGRIALEELVEEMADAMMMVDEVSHILQVPDEMRDRLLKKKMTVFRSRVDGTSKQSISEAKMKEGGPE